MPEIWMCEKSSLKSYLEKRQLITANLKIEDSILEKFRAEKNKSISIVNGRTAVININGILTEDGPSLWDYYFGIGGTSYRKIREEVGAADNDGAVDDKLLIFNTPGGSVDGADETYKSIRTGTKPTHALVTGMCASAGYYLAAGALGITARSPASWIGSVGVVVTDVDDKEFFERYGIYIVEVTSDHAENKRLSPLDKKGKEELKNTVNAYERQFHARIMEGRGVTREKIIKDFGRGSMFVALDPDSKQRDALSRGMIDEVKNGFESNDGFQKSEARKKGEVKMTLEEFLKENPGAKEEMRATIEAAVTLAVSQEREKNKQAAKLVLGNNYGKVVESHLSEVISGDVPFESLKTVITTLDAQAEQKKIDDAVDEQEKTGAVESGEGKPKEKDDDLEISTDADIEKATEMLY